MTEQALRKMFAAGDSTRQEFKSWVKCKDYRQRKELAVKSAVALANTKGGVLLFGVEDDGTITGCPKSDPQALMEAIYDMTRPSLFTEIEPVETADGVVLVVSVEKSNSHVATTGGIGTVSEGMILGALSVVIWPMTLVTTVKYVVIAMKADNHNEGLINAL